MDAIQSLGTDVLETVGPTYETYGNILRQPENASAIYHIQVKTCSYGPHPRNVLDLYEPDATVLPPLAGQKRPILIYVYGGAFMFGDRVLPEIPGEVVYRNIASFFAGRIGYTVIIMDYRLVKHGTKFPSGGEDMEEALQWIVNYFPGNHDLFLMGHSASGSHIATWMFSKIFQEKRDRFIEGTNGPRLRGTIFLSTPLSLTPELERLFEPYYGSPTEGGSKQPTSLLRELMQSGKSSFDNFHNSTSRFQGISAAPEGTAAL